MALKALIPPIHTVGSNLRSGQRYELRTHEARCREQIIHPRNEAQRPRYPDTRPREPYSLVQRQAVALVPNTHESLTHVGWGRPLPQLPHRPRPDVPYGTLFVAEHSCVITVTSPDEAHGYTGRRREQPLANFPR